MCCSCPRHCSRDSFKVVPSQEVGIGEAEPVTIDGNETAQHTVDRFPSGIGLDGKMMSVGVSLRLFTVTVMVCRSLADWG